MIFIFFDPYYRTMSLNDKQTEVLLLCDQGHNIFMTGPGGTGKSFLIHLIVTRYLHKHVKYVR